tara:strand:+ start:234 stop:854 length:621 start_codon:yes stop_codon:yes gene_type:complete
MYKHALPMLQESMSSLIKDIGVIKIGTKELFPYGWRKAAKGRTVWRLVEEVIVQNLEKNPSKYGLQNVKPATSEVSVYDLELSFKDIKQPIFINIKSSVRNARKNKDDISKAVGLIDFLKNNPKSLIFVITIELDFSENMEILLSNSFVMPTVWLPDVYVNPSNNGNLQSSKYKELETAIQRNNEQFLVELIKAKEIADEKRRQKV